MAIFKCKMCGGQLDIEDGQTVVECDYCGTKQTVPTLDNEKKVSLFTRANKLRAACDFDKAYSVYESIVAEFEDEAEAYWGLVLCKYGIEYVDDPATGKKVPTCHRTSFDGVMDDPNFEMVMENADSVARRVYREEAITIEDIRKGIIEVSSKEDPYDIFICYKETAEDGQRTIDSVLAQDIYNELTDKGYRVFFSRISLEDKLGQEYEPYIFSALNSAEVMLVVGTDYEYFNAVWVKNEWSRFLKLIANGQKKTLIPCFKDIGAYDMPKEFSKLQAQDLGKVGAIQDLLRGIEKIIPLKKEEQINVEATIKIKNDVAPLLKRAEMLLNDEEYFEAGLNANMVLNFEPDNTKAHLICLLSYLEIGSLESISKEWGISKYKEILGDKEVVKFRKYGSKEDIQILDDNIKALENILINKLKLSVDYAIEKKDFEFIDDIIDEYKIFSNYEESINRIKEAKEKIKTTNEVGLEERFNIAKEEKLRNRFRLVDSMMSNNSDGLFAAITENGDILVYQKEGKNTIQTPKDVWNNLVSVAVGDGCIYGVKENGTVLVAGNVSNIHASVKKWDNIAQVLPFTSGVIGLKKDGTLISTLPSKKYDLTSVNNVIRLLPSIDVGEFNVHVLHKNHTISKIGYDYLNERFKIVTNEYYKRTIDVYKYKFDNLLSIDMQGKISYTYDNISYDYNHIKYDGGIVVLKLYELSYSFMPLALTYDCKLLNGKAVKYDSKKRDYMTLFKENGIDEVVGVATTENNEFFIVSKEGYVYNVDDSSYKPTVKKLFDGQKMFSNFDNILENCFFSEEHKEIERKKQEEKQKEKEALMASRKEQGLCQHCGGTFKKSMFGTKCTSCGKSKDYQI